MSTTQLRAKNTRLARAIEASGRRAFQIGGEAGIDHATMTKLVKGERMAHHHLLALSRVLGREPEELLGTDDLPVDFESAPPNDHELARFWRYVKADGDHLIWIGDHFPDGVPRMKYANKSTQTLRLAYFWFVKPIPLGSHVRPCRYSRSCVNPLHAVSLYWSKQ